MAKVCVVEYSVVVMWLLQTTSNQGSFLSPDERMELDFIQDI